MPRYNAGRVSINLFTSIGPLLNPRDAKSGYLKTDSGNFEQFSARILQDPATRRLSEKIIRRDGEESGLSFLGESPFYIVRAGEELFNTEQELNSETKILPNPELDTILEQKLLSQTSSVTQISTNLAGNVHQVQNYMKQTILNEPRLPDDRASDKADGEALIAAAFSLCSNQERSNVPPKPSCSNSSSFERVSTVMSDKKPVLKSAGLQSLELTSFFADTGANVIKDDVEDNVVLEVPLMSPLGSPTNTRYILPIQQPEMAKTPHFETRIAKKLLEQVQALHIVVSLQKESLLKATRKKIDARPRQDALICIFYNGEFVNCQVVNSPDIDRKSGLSLAYSGRRVGIKSERAHTLIPLGQNADGHLRESTRRKIFSGKPIDKWEKVGVALGQEACRWGKLTDSSKTGVESYLELLAKISIPTDVEKLHSTTGQNFGIVDVVIVLGSGRKQRLDEKKFLVEPTRFLCSEYSKAPIESKPDLSKTTPVNPTDIVETRPQVKQSKKKTLTKRKTSQRGSSLEENFLSTLNTSNFPKGQLTFVKAGANPPRFMATANTKSTAQGLQESQELDVVSVSKFSKNMISQPYIEHQATNGKPLNQELTPLINKHIPKRVILKPPTTPTGSLEAITNSQATEEVKITHDSMPIDSATLSPPKGLKIPSRKQGNTKVLKPGVGYASKLNTAPIWQPGPLNEDCFLGYATDSEWPTGFNAFGVPIRGLHREATRQSQGDFKQNEVLIGVRFVVG